MKMETMKRMTASFFKQIPAPVLHGALAVSIDFALFVPYFYYKPVVVSVDQSLTSFLATTFRSKRVCKM